MTQATCSRGSSRSRTTKRCRSPKTSRCRTSPRPRKSPAAMKIFCLKCQKKTATNGLKMVVTKNKRHAARGTCAACGTKKYQFVAQ